MTEYRSIGVELHSIGNLLRRICENSSLCNYHRKTELTEMQTRVISYLYVNRDHDIFQRDIEKEFSVRRATVSVLLRTMELKQLITRESVDYDARLKKVVLTEKAENIAQVALQEVSRFEEMLQEGISSEDMDTFFRVMAQVRGNIERHFTVKTEKGEANAD
ncbi:MAG: hypothetical protein IKV45_03740 [Firmicutes bacterium]|nr:hypothetical protein [Bacillota bacterium]